MPDRKTLEAKRRKQRARALDRTRAVVQAERDRVEHDAKVADDWQRFVAIRFPNRSGAAS